MTRKQWITFLGATALALNTQANEPLVALGSAEAVLDFARSHLPQAPMQIDGTLYVKAANNFPKNKYPVQMLLEWGKNRATYSISDRDSDLQQRLTVTFPERGQPGYQFFSGAELAPAAMPDPLSKIGETDISWADLSLSFFWWPNAKLVDYTSKKGRSAYVIDIPAPATEQDLSKVRVWIDMKLGMMIEAAMYGKDGNKQRNMRVVSIKKVQEGFWMVKNIDITRPGTKERTKLQIDSVEIK
ncbi:outer membrane lipoprotein-sorting protein [Verrucomicrobiota bacterium]